MAIFQGPKYPDQVCRNILLQSFFVFTLYTESKHKDKEFSEFVLMDCGRLPDIENKVLDPLMTNLFFKSADMYIK
jgi:hypothetical protein